MFYSFSEFSSAEILFGDAFHLTEKIICFFVFFLVCKEEKNTKVTTNQQEKYNKATVVSNVLAEGESRATQHGIHQQTQRIK